jgi:hypothetical protein
MMGAIPPWPTPSRDMIDLDLRVVELASVLDRRDVSFCRRKNLSPQTKFKIPFGNVAR